MRTRIKVCGVTRAADAKAAAEHGADALGLVFYAPSPRALDIAAAEQVCEVVPPFVSIVALFLDADDETVTNVLRSIPVDVIQFHGQESAAVCESFGRRYIKGLSMAEGAPPATDQAASHPRACGFLLDSHALGQAGGTGKAFDWRRYPRDIDRPLVLAGGLNADTVGEAVRATRPWAVDVSSGVEIEPGIKDPERIKAFVKEVERVQYP